MVGEEGLFEKYCVVSLRGLEAVDGAEKYSLFIWIFWIVFFERMGK